MLLRKKVRDEGIRPLRGWAKFFHRLGRLLLWPFRHPLLTFFVLLFLFLAPTFRGVKPVNVHKWYGNQISALYNRALVWWGIREPEVKPGAFKFTPEEAAPAPVTPSELKVEPVDVNAPNILDVLKGGTEPETKPEEEKVQPDEEDVKSEAEDVKPEESKPVVRNNIRLPKDESLYAYPEEKKVYALKYVDYPHEVVGKAVVHNCNEIEIDGEFIMMYGIYVHPYTARGVAATKYLKEQIDGKEVKCGIVAYTDQDIATGICYYGDENINRTMVVNGYTKNVAL